MRLTNLFPCTLFIVLFLSQMAYAQELEGPLKVCESECYEYYYFGENGGPFFWTVEGGLMEDNRGEQVTICWEEVQTASIQIINASVSQTIPVLDVEVVISATPVTDIVFPLYPLCQIKRDSMDEGPNGEFPELENCKTVCPGSIVTYFSTSTEAFQSQWIVEGHQNIDSDSLRNGTVHWNNEGVGSILLIEETAAGCIDSSFYCIEIMDAPDVALEVLNSGIDLQNLCKGQPLYLQGSASEALTYEWKTSDGQRYEGAEVTIGFDQSGIHTISLYTTTECFCRDSTTLEVQVIDDVVPNITCVGTTCAGEEQTYYAEDLCGSYNWSISPKGSITDGGNSTDNFISVVWNDGPVGTLSLSTAACDENNICTGTTEVLIPIMGTNMEIDGPSVACKNGSSISYAVPYFSGATYTWSIAGNGYISDGWGTNVITITWNTYMNSPDNSTIEVFVDNCFLECTSNSSKVVDLKEKFHVSTSETACEGSIGYLAAVVGYSEVPVDWTMRAPDGSLLTLATGVGFYNVTYDQGPGRYELFATENTGTYCNSEDRVSIEVFPRPEPPKEIIGAELICVGQSYLYKLPETQDNYVYTWTIRDGTSQETLEGPEVLVTWLGAGPYRVSVVVEDVDTKCESESRSLQIVQAAGGTLAGNDKSCLDQRGTYKITGVLPHNISWEVIPAAAGTIAILEEGEIAVHWHQPGNHKVIADYCNVQYEMEVTILSAPMVSVVVPDGVCVGEKAEVTFNGPAGSSYRVFDEKERIISETTTEPAMLSPGYYGVEVIDINGCTARESFYLDSYEKPVINISTIGWHQLCVPGGTAYLESPAMNGGLSYQWYKNGNPVGNDSPKYLADEEGDYRLVVTNADGCTAEETKYLECREGGGSCDCRSDGGTRFEITKTAFCNVYDFKNTSFDFIPGTLRYDFGDPESGADNYSSDENPSHVFSKAGYYVVSLRARVNSTITPGEECLAVYQAYVTVEAAADFDHISACANEDIIFKEQSNFLVDYNIDSYEWDFGDPSSGADNTSTLEDPIHVFNGPGIYQVSLTITTDVGCKAEITKEIEIYGQPEIDFNLPFSKCIEEGLEFVVSSPAYFHMEWSFGDPSSGASNSSTYLAPIHSFMTAGTYTINLKGVSIHGCEDSITKTITVSENTLAGDILMDKTMPMCLGETATLTAPAGGIAYLWSTGETQSEILVTESGIYSVTITGANVCDYVPDAVIVNTIKPISPEIRATTDEGFYSIFNELAICHGERFTLRASYHFQVDYLWSTGHTSRNLEYSDLSSLTPGEHLIELEVRDVDSGCVIHAEPFNLTIYPNPATVSISSNQTDNCEGPEFVFSVDNADPDLRYFWNNGEEGTSITVSKPDFYFATAVNQYGCTRSSNGIRINPLPKIESFLTGCQEVCFPKTLCLNSESSIIAVQWLLDGQAIPAPMGTAATLEATTVGAYQAVLTNIYGCTATTGTLSLTPETNQQTLSGIAYIDEDGDGAFTLGEAQLSGVKVSVISGNTVVQETTTDLTGSYLFDPLQISQATVVIDTSGIGFDADPLEIEYNFELLDCIEDLTQDFPLSKDCKKSSEQIVLFTCANEQATFEGQQYAVAQNDTLYRINAEGCDSLVYLEIQAYPLATAQTITASTCPGEAGGSVELVGASSLDLEYSLDGGAFTTELLYTDLAEGQHMFIIRDTYSCETELSFSIVESVLPQVGLDTEVDCDNIGTLTITNLGTGNLMFAVDGSGAFSSDFEITNQSPGSHLLSVQDENGCIVTQSFTIDNYVVPVIDFSTGQSCFDGLSGSLEIDPTSSPNLSFAIDSPSGLSSETSYVDISVGNHILYVEDAVGCSYEFPFEINASSRPNFTLNTTNSCVGVDGGGLELSTSELGLSFSLDNLTYTTDLQFSNLSTGTQILYVRTSDGCQLEETFIIDNFAATIVTVQTSKTCFGQSTGTIDVISPSSSLEYSIDGGALSSIPSFEDLSVGTYDVKVRDENGCEQILRTDVAELPEMQISFPDAVTCNTLQVDLTPIVVQGESLTYLWSDGSSDASLLATETGTYTVEVSDGCKTELFSWDLDIATDVISTELYIPNIFNPNDLGVNNAFGVQFSEDLNVTSFELKIMDKWGNDLYTIDDHNEVWDGRVNNSKINPGVFLWTCKAEYELCSETKEVQSIGNVTILR